MRADLVAALVPLVLLLAWAPPVEAPRMSARQATEAIRDLYGDAGWTRTVRRTSGPWLEYEVGFDTALDRPLVTGVGCGELRERWEEAIEQARTSTLRSCSSRRPR